MAWLLNRPGQERPEGPYEDAFILRLIQGGELTDGVISEVGTGHWRSLAEHPPFALALQRGGRRRASGTLVMTAESASQFGAGPAAPGTPQAAATSTTPTPSAQPEFAAMGGAGTPSPQYSPHPHPPHQPATYEYGGNVAGLPPGAPPPGWGQAAGATPAFQDLAPRAPTEKKPRLGRLLTGGAVGLLLLATVVGGALWLFKGPSSRLSALVPADVVVYFEVPSTTHALARAARVHFLDTDAIDLDKPLKQHVKTLNEGLGLAKDDAESLVLNVDGFALALRRPAQEEQLAALFSFRNSAPVTKLLATERFTEAGKFGSNGVRYSVAPAKTEPSSELAPSTQSLLSLTVPQDNKELALVWFEKEKLLAAGTPELLSDVDRTLDARDKSLAKSEPWKLAKIPSGAAAISFVSPALLDQFKTEEQRQLIRGYLDGVKPFSASWSFVEAGSILRLRGQLRGSKLSEDQLLSDPGTLDLQNKLPMGTLLYLTLGTRHEDDGKALKSRLLKQVRATDENASLEVERGLAELEKITGLPFEKLVEALGDQLTLALVVDPSVKLNRETPLTGYMDKSALLLLARVGQRETAETVITNLRTRMFEEEGVLKDSYEIKQQVAGFQGVPKAPQLPTVQVFFHERVLLIGAGGRSVLAKSLLALGGKESLSDDKAHNTALSALPKKARALLWTDTGRIGDTVLNALPEAEQKAITELEKELGLTRKAIRWSGDQRLTAAIAVSVDTHKEAWDYNVDALNVESFGVLGLLGSLFPSSPTSFEAPPSIPVPPDLNAIPAVPEIYLPATGVPQCDGLLIFKFQCGTRTNDQALINETKAAEARFKAEFADAAQKATAGERCGQELVQFMAANQKCVIP